MREIKFRAWSKFDSGHMHYWDDGFNYRRFDRTGDKYVVLMQYTGVKDKNGKEVFEGDIVMGLGVVKWFDRDAKYMLYFRNGDKPTVEVNAAKFSEVIGNIYEDPELLTKEKEGKS